MYYLFTINKYLGQRSFFTQEELDYADTLEEYWLSTLKKPTFYELLDIFPEAKPIIRRHLNDHIKQYKQDLREADKVRVMFNNTIAHIPYEDRWFYELLRDIVHVNPLKEGRERLIKRYYFYLSALKPSATTMKKNRITNTDIQRAKDIPLESLYTGKLDKHGNTLVGKCELHSENHGSFVVYLKQNRWWCFGACGMGGDSINYIQKRDGIGFLEAVKKLL